MKYEHIIDYLIGTAGPSIERTGLSDERVNKRNEAGMALSFSRYICGVEGDEGCDYFKVNDDEQLFAFNGRYYELITKEILLKIIVTVMDKCEVGIVYRTSSANFIRDYVIDMLRADERCKLVADRRYICFNNGVFDLKDMKLKDFSLQFKTDIILDFDYIEGTKSALWDKVLSQTVPDESMRETFHQFCGCL